MSGRVNVIDELLLDQLVDMPHYSRVFMSVEIKGVNLKRITEKVKMPKSSVHSILKRFVRAGLLSEVRGLDGRYKFYFYTLRGLRLNSLLSERIIEMIPKVKIYLAGRGEVEAFANDKALQTLSRYVPDPEGFLIKRGYTLVQVGSTFYWVKTSSSK